MAGIYGNHPEDRAREKELEDYLDFMYGSRPCQYCGHIRDDDELNEEDVCIDCQEDLKWQT